MKELLKNLEKLYKQASEYNEPELEFERLHTFLTKLSEVDISIIEDDDELQSRLDYICDEHYNGEKSTRCILELQLAIDLVKQFRSLLKEVE